MAPGKVKRTDLSTAGFGPSTRSKGEANAEVIKRHVKGDDAMLQPSSLSQVWANFTVADLAKVASGSARLNLRHNNRLKALIVYAYALLLICSQVRPTPEQAIACVNLVEIPTKYGMEVYHSLLKKALTWIDNNVNTIKFGKALVFQDTRIGWKAHVTKWTVETTLEEMESTRNEGNNVVIWRALPAKQPGVDAIVKEAVREVTLTGIWNVRTNKTESKKALAQMLVLPEAVGVFWHTNGIPGSAKIEKHNNGAFNVVDANNSPSLSKSNDTVFAQEMNTHLPNTAKARAKSPDPFENMVMSSAASSTDGEAADRTKNKGKRNVRSEVSNDDKIKGLKSDLQQINNALDEKIENKFVKYDEKMNDRFLENVEFMERMVRLVKEKGTHTDQQFRFLKAAIGEE